MFIVNALAMGAGILYLCRGYSKQAAPIYKTFLCLVALSVPVSFATNIFTLMGKASGTDGTVSVVLYDAAGNVLDTYKLDPLTGKETNTNGEVVDLPQTGNQDCGTAVAAAGAGMLTMTGLFMLLRSFGHRKRKHTL